MATMRQRQHRIRRRTRRRCLSQRECFKLARRQARFVPLQSLSPCNPLHPCSVLALFSSKPGQTLVLLRRCGFSHITIWPSMLKHGWVLALGSPRRAKRSIVFGLPKLCRRNVEMLCACNVSSPLESIKRHVRIMGKFSAIGATDILAGMQELLQEIAQGATSAAGFAIGVRLGTAWATRLTSRTTSSTHGGLCSDANCTRLML